MFSQLASNQRDIWHDQHAHPKSPLYNIGGTLIISGKVNYKCLNKAIQHLINENDAFRITINNRLPTKQRLLKQIHFDLEFIDFSNDTKPEDKALQWLNHCFQQPFSFHKNNLLWHFSLIKESESRYYLMTKYHHLIADGWSTTVVIARLAEIYNAFLNKQPIKQKSPHRYFDFIKQEQEYLRSSSYKIDHRYWEKTLPTTPEPLISRRYALSSKTLLPKANSYQITLSRSLLNSIDQLSSTNKSTRYQTILSSLAIYFSRIYQRKEIIIGVPSLNRKGARFKDTFGMFISLSPLVINIEKTENSSQIIKKSKARLRELYRHQRYPLNDICKRLKLLNHGRDTLFDIVLSYEKHQYSSTYGTATIRAKQQFSGVARYPLAVTICDFSDNDDITVFFEGAENCFTTEDLQFFADRFLSILQQICITPESPINEIDLLTTQDKQIIFEQFNQKRKQQTTYTSVIQLFQQQVKKQPSKTAIEYKNKKLNYHQLDTLSTQLAQLLLNKGVQTNDIIAICLPQCPEIIISIFAILKASAAYLVISADSPDARIKNILKQSQSGLLLSNNSYQERLTNLHDQLVCVDDYQSYPASKIEQPNTIDIKAKNLAYIIFTSGSNGQPKGVLVDHQALSSRIHWLQSFFKLTSKDRMGQTIHYNFDPSIIEIFLSLTQGASLILRPEDSHISEGFAQFVIDKQISSLALVPSSARLLLQGLEASQKTNLRIACCGGERLSSALAQQFQQKTKATLFNVYGPTEATIAASAWEYTASFSGKMLPIGLPAENTSIYILDNDLNNLPVNVEGEIFIAGNTLAQGYINHPELQNQVFLTGNDNQSQLYRTGDKGYVGYDGLLYFSGRIDRQIKISGYRIEPGEIESVLQSHHAVDQAVVNFNTKNNHTSIYAHIETKEQNTEVLVDELSLLLRQQLPNYMQPKSIIPSTSIKTTETGKIDYTQLPIPSSKATKNRKAPPYTLLERQLHRQWEKVLPYTKIGLDENFFELGGDSISAISLMIAIEKLTKTRYPLSFLLNYPTIAEQANQLEITNLNPDQRVLLTLSNHPRAPTLFIAASGHGDFMRLSNLANTLGVTCSTYLLQPPNTHKILSIHEIAHYYADSIIQHGNTPYYLSGFSIGGITALETAKILIKKGHSPKGLILFDSIYPRWPLQSPTLFKLIKSTVKTFQLNKMILNNRKLGAMLSDQGMQSQLQALPNHTIQGIEIPVDLILTKRMWMFHPLIFSTWKRLFKKHLSHHSVSGLHGEMFQHPHCQKLASIIKKIIHN